MSGAWSSLFSAALGGLLVLAGDGVRRRAERRDANRRLLFESAVRLGAMYNAIAGVLIDDHQRGVPLANVRLPDEQRYEAATRFWAAPGSPRLSVEGSNLARTWENLLQAYDDPTAWTAAWRAHTTALRAFEASIRRVMGDAEPLPNP